MKKILVAFLCWQMLLLPARAECQKPVTKLERGANAPCDGYLFSPKKEKEVAQLNENNKLTLEKLSIYEDLVSHYKKDNKLVEEIVTKERAKTELWRKAAEDSTKQLIESEGKRGKRDWLFFILGIFVTGAAAYTLDKIER